MEVSSTTALGAHRQDVEVVVTPGIQPIINASFNNLVAAENSRLNALVNIAISKPEELTEIEYEELLRPSLHSWIDSPNFEADLAKQLSHLKNQDNGTSATWIFEQSEFQQWRTKHDGQRILWIAGRPGSGKSVIAASIIQMLKQEEVDNNPKRSEEPNIFFGYAFGSKNDEDKKQSSSLLVGILWQIVTLSSLSIRQKRKVVKTFRRFSKGSLSQQAQSEVLEVLAQYMALFEKMILVFDGVDECVNPGQFVKGVVSLVRLAEVDIRVVFISQKLEEISDELDDDCLIVDMDSRAVRVRTEEDIMHYTQTSIMKLATTYSKSRPRFKSLSLSSKPQGGPPKLNMITDNIDVISKKLVLKADGMFLWAAVAIPDIVSRFMRSGATLDELIDSIDGLPEKMEELFSYLLERITHADPRLGIKENEQRGRYMLILLRWVLHTTRPLTIPELQDVISTQPTPKFPSPHKETLELVTGENLEIDFLASIARAAYPLVVLGDETLTLTLMHVSFRDFIKSNDVKASSALEISESLGSVDLVADFIEATLKYLAVDSFDFGVYLSNGKAATIESNPFYEYGCSSWVTQIDKMDSVPVPTQEAVASFLQSDKALTWLETWLRFNYWALAKLQSIIYSKISAVNEPSWCIEPLTRCVRLRKLEDENASDIMNMTRVLAGALSAAGMFSSAIQHLESILEKGAADGRGPHDFDYTATENDIANVYNTEGKCAKAAEIYRRVLKRYTESTGETSYATLAVQVNLGGAMLDSGQIEEAVELLQDAHEKEIKILGEAHFMTLRTLDKLVMAQLELGQFATAKTLATEEVRLYKKDDGPTSEGLIIATGNLAMAEDGIGNTALALELREDTWRRLCSRFGPRSSQALISKINIASSLNHLSRPEEAEEIAREALQGLRQIYGNGSLRTLRALGCLLIAVSCQGKLLEAAQLGEELLDNSIAVMGETHLCTLGPLNELSTIYGRLGDWEKAKCFSLRAYAILVETSNHEDTNLARSTQNLSYVAGEQGYILLADWLAHSALDMFRRVLGEEHQLYVEALRTSACRKMITGDWKGSMRMAKAGTKSAIAMFGSLHEFTVSTRENWADALIALGHVDQGSLMLEEVLDLRLKLVRRVDGALFMTQQSIVRVHLAQMRFDTALDEAMSISQESRKHLSEDAMVHLYIDVTLADALIASQRFEEAQVIAERALEQIARSHGPGNHMKTKVQDSLGAALCGLGHFKQAQELHLQAAQAQVNGLGFDHPSTVSAVEALRKTLAAQGSYDDDLYFLAKWIVQSRETILGHSHYLTKQSQVAWETIRAKHTRGKADLQNGDLRAIFAKVRAKKYIPESKSSRLYNQAKAFFGEDHPLTLKIRVDGYEKLSNHSFSNKAVVVE